MRCDFELAERLTQVNDDDKAVLIYSTFPDALAADAVGARLIELRLAACVNIIPGMASIYFWDGRLERSQEVVMIIKTRASLADPAIDEGRRLHPYTTPAFVTLPVSGGSAPYLEWLMSETKRPA